MIVFKQLEASDASSVALSLRKASEDGYLSYFHPFPFEESAIRAAITSCEKDRYVGIWDDDAFVGFFMLRGIDDGYEIPMFGVYVSPPFAKRGIAGMALRQAEEDALLIGANAIRLKVYPDNARAIGIYLSAGFEQISRRDNQLLMQKLLVKSLPDPPR